MKLKTKFFCAILAMFMLVFTLVGCSKSEIKLNDFKLPYTPDGSIAHLSGSRSVQMLSNIDRGFRLETYYTLGSGRAWPTDEGSDGYKMLDEEIEYYKDDKAVEIQVYIYLNEYYRKPLDERALEQMKKYFQTIRDCNMSMLLRFAYDYSQAADESRAPTQDMMLKHISQIKQFNKQNEQLIKDTVTAYQFGMIGAWGEWGATAEKYNEKDILNALINAFPDGTYFQGRYMRVVNQTDKNEKSAYVGYHNDFLVGRPHPWNTAGDKYYKKDYKKFFENAPYRLNDGEMPWGGYTDEPDEKIDGISFLKQMSEHCMGTLSIKHNYIEPREGKDGVVRNSHNLARWKNEYVTAEILKANKLPYYEEWFKDFNGKVIKRSIYEYLRDYLGYVLMLDNLSVSMLDGNTIISFNMYNYGLGSPLTINDMEWVVADDISGKNAYTLPIIYNSNIISACRGDQFVNVFMDDLSNKVVGVRIKRGSYTIKTANDIPYVNGVNYFYNI